MAHKGTTGTDQEGYQIDQIILTPVSTINLVKNPGFQLGLTNWVSNNSNDEHTGNYEGTGHAILETGNAMLAQDVPLADLPANSSFLLIFAANTVGVNNLMVDVIWLDNTDTPIVAPSLSLVISVTTLQQQGNYLTYLEVTPPAPAGAVKARIVFTAQVGGAFESVSIDKVILARTKSPNLVQNHSIENGISPWIFGRTTVQSSNQAYERDNVAEINEDGGFLFQDIPIAPAAGRCFLLNFGYNDQGPTDVGDLLAEVYWLNNNGMEIGLGLSLVVPQNVAIINRWLVYTGITEPAPLGAAKARVQFSKSEGQELFIDKVVLVSLV